MRKKVATRRGTSTFCPPFNLPQKGQVNIRIHIHSHSSPILEPMVQNKNPSRCSSSVPTDAGTSRANTVKGKRPMTDEEPPTSPLLHSSSHP
ncbi:hypothetical protein AHAS_Ahas20G0197600 [Arachis hypogaea]